jgi:5-methylcytosine-specific restriction endonuclease McrA
MPKRAPRICPCGKIIAAGVACPCQLQRIKERKARHDAARPTASQRGYDSKWREAREGFLKRHPTCIVCKAPAVIVDHIRPHKGDKALFWNRSNWQPLCVTCHSSRKQSQERRGQA